MVTVKKKYNEKFKNKMVAMILFMLCAFYCFFRYLYLFKNIVFSLSFKFAILNIINLFNFA